MTRPLTARNLKIVRLRNQGMTLQTIGDMAGVCRERVREIIKKQKGDTKFPDSVMTEKRLAQYLQTSTPTLCRLRKKGLIHAINWGVFIYSPEEAQRIKNLMIKTCPNCGKIFQSFSFRFCPECRPFGLSTLWRFCSEKCKLGRTRASLHWQEAHPERWKELRRKASAKSRRRLEAALDSGE